MFAERLFPAIVYLVFVIYLNVFVSIKSVGFSRKTSLIRTKYRVVFVIMLKVCCARSDSSQQSYHEHNN